jgi:hypothetical protein
MICHHRSAGRARRILKLPLSPMILTEFNSANASRSLILFRFPQQCHAYRDCILLLPSPDDDGHSTSGDEPAPQFYLPLVHSRIAGNCT